jgi:LemA protein
MWTAIIVAVVALVVLVWAVSAYNGLVTLRNRFKNAFSQIDVQLKRRYDLIPNLVEIAKGYLKHERETLEAVIAARNGAAGAASRVAADPADPTAMKGLIAAETALTGTMGRFFALSESYPDLKANSAMLQLSEELASTENKVAFARQAYNDAVMTDNTAREVFPNSIIAGFGQFLPADPFTTDHPAERNAPQVRF